MAYYEERIKAYNEEYRRSSSRSGTRRQTCAFFTEEVPMVSLGSTFLYEDFHEEIDVMKEDRIIALETEGFKWSLVDDEEVY
jgi:hypothetical protein